MEKAFDLKALEAELKAQGLPAIEGLAELVAKAVAKWVKDSAPLLGQPLAALLIPLAVDALLPELLKEINKIDGVEG